MRRFALFLKLLAPIFLFVGGLHLILGLGADAMLGAQVPPDAMRDPALNSQNRFYGIAFTLYGVLLFLCATVFQSTPLFCGAFSGFSSLRGLPVCWPSPHMACRRP